MLVTVHRAAGRQPSLHACVRVCMWHLLGRAGVVPSALACLQDVDPGARKLAATLVRDTVRLSEALARQCVDAGAVPCLLEYSTMRAKGGDR